jgi:hypothetical protein
VLAVLPAQPGRPAVCNEGSCTGGAMTADAAEFVELVLKLEDRNSTFTERDPTPWSIMVPRPAWHRRLAIVYFKAFLLGYVCALV